MRGMHSFHILYFPFNHLELYSINFTSTPTNVSLMIISNVFANILTLNPRIVSKTNILTSQLDFIALMNNSQVCIQILIPNNPFL
jgi:hypothetical protein